MPHSLLIVTPQASFGNYLRQGLDPARFDAFSTSDFTESINYVRKNKTVLVILDTELEDVQLSMMDIGFALRQVKPEIQFIIVGAAGQKVDSASLSPLASLVKPVSLPDLERLVEGLLAPAIGTKPAYGLPSRDGNGAGQRADDTNSHLVWLRDVSKAAQHLTRLTLESSAQAALITQQNELWAYAGQLSRDAAQELTQLIQRYSDAEGDSEMMRFVRLQATEAQHMLYARRITGNLMLALVFDAETPFSTIRSQAGKLVKNLAESSIIALEKTPDAASTPQELTPVLAAGLRSVTAPTAYDDEDDELPPISELLGDVPPPIPPRTVVKSVSSLGQKAATAPEQYVDVVDVSLPPSFFVTKEKSLPEHFSREVSPPIRREEIKRPLPAMDETFASPAPTQETNIRLDSGIYELDAEMQMTRKQEVHSHTNSINETRPQASPDPMSLEAHSILLEPASPVLANLIYACLLIPRFSNHHLVGDFAARLNDWIPQICVAFGWRLEHISVRPDYLQWVVRVPPSTAPGYLMRIIRQHTSDRIFAEFPRFKNENPSGDFWAPGYLIMGSPQLHPQKLVRDYIKLTRSRQGL